MSDVKPEIKVGDTAPDFTLKDQDQKEVKLSEFKGKKNVVLAFLFNGIGIPAAATGLVQPVWAMVAMAASVTTIFLNSLWGRPGLFVDAVRSVGRPGGRAAPASTHTAAAEG